MPLKSSSARARTVVRLLSLRCFLNSSLTICRRAKPSAGSALGAVPGIVSEPEHIDPQPDACCSDGRANLQRIGLTPAVIKLQPKSELQPKGKSCPAS